MSGSIYDAIAHPAAVQINPLANFGAALDVTNKLNDARLFAARQAAGQAYQQATDPATGQVDTGKAQALIAADPRAAPLAAQMATSGQDLRTAQLGFNAAQQGQIAQAIGAQLTQSEAAQTPEAYARVLAERHANGTIDDRHYANAMSQLQQAGTDPQSLRAFGVRLLVGTLGGPEMARTVLPTVQNVNTGDTLQPNVQQPAILGGAMTRAPGAVTMTTSPETRAALHTMWQKDPSDPTGQRMIQVIVPRSALPNATGADQPAGQPASVQPAPIPGNGAYRPRGTVAGATPSVPPATPAVTTPAVTTPAVTAPPATAPAGTPSSGPGQTASATPPAASPVYLAQPPQGQQEGVNADVTAYKADQMAVPGINTGLQNLITAKQALKLAETGRSTEAVHNFYSFLKSQNVLPGFKDNDVTQYDIARKAMLGFASTQGTAAGTNLGLEAQLHSNASPDIDQSAADHVITQNIGLQRQKLAQIMQAPTGGIGYGDHVTQFTGRTDPRAFAWDVYSPAERAAIIAQAKTVEGGYQKLKDSLKIAVDRHLVQLPTAAAP